MSRMFVDSSHVRGDFSDGRLVLVFQPEDAARGISGYDPVTVSVPPGYHVHNDTVATAVMAIIGSKYGEVGFNFPISIRCADLLAARFPRSEIGPVDPQLSPREPGRNIGLALSGGLDSIAIQLLFKAAGIPLRVIAVDYGGIFVAEREGYERLPRDVTPWTDLRQKGYTIRSHFFIGAVPLLFADYLDLWGLAFGHKLEDAIVVARWKDGEGKIGVPSFGWATPAAVQDVAPVVPLTTAGVARIVARLNPELIRSAILSNTPPRTRKRFSKGLIARWACVHEGSVPQPCIDELGELPADRRPFGTAVIEDLRALFLVKQLGGEQAARYVPGLEHFDLSWLDELSFAFFSGYDPSLLALIPAPLRAPLAGAWQQLGIAPWGARERDEFNTVLDFLTATVVSER